MIKSQMRIVISCPWCKKPIGYAFDRDGLVENNELIGRFWGNSLECINCKNPIELLVNVKYKKGKKKK